MHGIYQNSNWQPGYLVAVSAPNSGIPEMADGSWHVIAEMRGDQMTGARTTAQQLIPFVRGTGGDLVMFRMDDVPTVVLRQGGKEGSTPDVEDIVPYDENLALLLESRRAAFEAGSVVRKVEVRANPYATPMAIAAYVCAVVMTVAGAGLAFSPSKAPPPSLLDRDPDKAAALLRGAMEVTMVDPSDAEFMITVRYYPVEGREPMRHIVDRFHASLMLRTGHRKHESPTGWLRYW